MVPNGWEIKTLTELTNEKLSYGANAPSCEYRENALRYIRITDINDFGNLNEDCVGIEKSVGINYSLKHHDFLFARSGNTVGKTFLYDENIHPKSAYAGYLIRYRPNQELLLAEYLKQYCFSEYYHKWVQSQLRAGAQPNINAKEYGGMEIPLPPLPEQQKIAKILTTWDKAISTTERLIDNSKQQKKALMQQLLSGKKRLLDEDGKRFEGEWVNLKVEEIGEIVTGSTPPKNDPTNYGNDISWATADDFKQKYIFNTNVKLSLSGAKKARLVPKGSVLVTCIASIGKNAIADEQLATNQQINSVVVNKQHSNEFFYYLIGFYKHKLVAWAGTTAVPILNKTSFGKLSFNFPPLEEQQKIAAVLTNADKEIELLEQQLADLQQEKKALMQVLLTGKVRVKV